MELLPYPGFFLLPFVLTANLGQKIVWGAIIIVHSIFSTPVKFDCLVFPQVGGGLYVGRYFCC